LATAIKDEIFRNKRLVADKLGPQRYNLHSYSGNTTDYFAGSSNNTYFVLSYLIEGVAQSFVGNLEDPDSDENCEYHTEESQTGDGKVIFDNFSIN
jgi:hypothetical protein